MPTPSPRAHARFAAAAVIAIGLTVAAGSADAADPRGNNGTVKVAPYGDVDAIPNNHPHVGCVFQLEWFGFDANVTSTVLFEEQAPTTGVGMSVAGDTTVDLDDDPGAGAGNGGLDGTQAYTLSFAGAPHPQQGYHVKLTINTPESNGATVKHKVFWVEGCGPVTPTPSPTQTPTTPATSPSATPTTVTSALPSSTPAPETSSTQTPTPTEGPTTTLEPEVLGEQAFEEEKGDDVLAQQANQLLPTAVHAGVVGQPQDDRVVRTLLGLALVLAGAASGRLAWLRRARG